MQTTVYRHGTALRVETHPAFSLADFGLGSPASETVPAAWYRPARDFPVEFQKAFGRSPNADETKIITEQVRLIKGGMDRHEELTFEHHHGVLDFFLRNGRMPSGYPSNDVGENQQLVREAMSRVDAHVAAYEQSHPSLLQSVANVVTAPARSAAEAGIKAATGKDVTVTSVSVSPAQLAAAIEAVLSFVPVIGTGINAAIAAGEALANGENITDALVAGAKNALPGGAIASKGFDLAYGAVKAIASGKPIDEIALAAAREALPNEEAKKAFDIGTAIAHGQNVQQALVSGAASFAAGQFNKIALPPVLTEVAKSLPAETTRIATAIVNRPELANLAVSEIAKRLGTNETTVSAASKAVTAAKNSDAMVQLAKLTPQEQKDLVAYIALGRLTPEQQKQLVAYVKAKTAPRPLISVHETTPAKNPVVVTAPSKPKPAAPPTVVAKVSTKAGIYPPYPKKMSGTVSAPPPHHAPPHHGDHPRVFRGGHSRPDWRWDAPSVIVTQAECRTWGDPIAMSGAMQTAAKAALGASGGRPTVARAPDGVLYLFSFETGGGLSARPCAA